MHTGIARRIERCTEEIRQEAFMIKSMTGFGRAEVMEENRKFTVEIKSVNHRYFDVNINSKLHCSRCSLRK